MTQFAEPGLRVSPVSKNVAISPTGEQVAYANASNRYDLRHYDVAPDGSRFLLLTEGDADGGDRPAPQINVVLNWSQELLERVPVP